MGESSLKELRVVAGAYKRVEHYEKQIASFIDVLHKKAEVVMAKNKLKKLQEPAGWAWKTDALHYTTINNTKNFFLKEAADGGATEQGSSINKLPTKEKIDAAVEALEEEENSGVYVKKLAKEVKAAADAYFAAAKAEVVYESFQIMNLKIEFNKGLNELPEGSATNFMKLKNSLSTTANLFILPSLNERTTYQAALGDGSTLKCKKKRESQDDVEELVFVFAPVLCTDTPSATSLETEWDRSMFAEGGKADADGEWKTYKEAAATCSSNEKGGEGGEWPILPEADRHRAEMKKFLENGICSVQKVLEQVKAKEAKEVAEKAKKVTDEMNTSSAAQQLG